MQLIKFTINENYYNEFKEICVASDVTIKRKINVILAGDVTAVDINEYFPEDHNQNPKKVTLKVNEEFYKGVMKNCGRFDIRTSKYIPYLIYRYLLENK